MKIAVLSDIHGNVPALEAVIEDVAQFGADAVFVNGDVVSRGPCSLRAWQLVCERRDRDGWRLLRGNHEDYVVRSHAGLESGASVPAIHRMSAHVAAQLGGEAPALGDLPDGDSVFLPGGAELRMRHASMRGNTDGIDPDAAPEKLREQIAPPPACFVTGHTHRAFSLQVERTLLVNAGAVGSPADGDARASYVRIRWRDGAFDVESRRVDYDRERARRDYLDEAWLIGAGPLAALLYVELLHARPVLADWMDRNLAALRAQQIDLPRAVASEVEAWGEDPRLAYAAAGAPGAAEAAKP